MSQQIARATSSVMGPLRAEYSVWGLFWRNLLMNFVLFVVPAPWLYTMMRRYEATNILLPDGRHLTFSGRPADIWIVAAGIGMLGMANGDINNLIRFLGHDYPQLINTVLTFILPEQYRFTITVPPADLWVFTTGPDLPGWVHAVLDEPGNQLWSSIPRIVIPLLHIPLWWMILRWFCASIGTTDGSVRLNFVGGVWSFIGWLFLSALSLVTIVLWPWCLRYWICHICDSIEGTHRVSFNGTGSALLWRNIAVLLAFATIIPLPWAMCWYWRWFVSGFHVEERAQ